MILIKKIFAKIIPSPPPSLRHVFSLYCFIFAFWSLYRYFPEIFSLWVEELIFKPLIWLLPTYYMVLKIERRKLNSLGYSKKNLFSSLYWGIGLGFLFAIEGLLTNIVKYRGIFFPEVDYSLSTLIELMLLSFATAFSEETVFRGYIFSRLWRIWKNEWLANFVSAILFALIHLPIGIFVLGYTPGVMLTYLFFIFIYGLGAAFVFARSGNIVSSILMHVFWGWPIILFR